MENLSDPPSDTDLLESKAALRKRMELESRLVRQTLLAKPHPRRLLPSPDPRLYWVGGTRPVSQAALIYRPTKRIKLLSKLAESKKRSKYVKPEPPKHIVSPDALVAVPSPRILELAQVSSATKLEPVKPVKKKMDAKAKKFLENRPAWLELRAGPKPKPQPPPEEKIRPAYVLSPEEREERFKKLAQPKYVHVAYKDPPLVSPAALRYVPSKRILEISGPKELDPETVLSLNYNPYKIKWTALHYKASDRVKEIALPNVRKKKDDGDLKENPFAVNPRALKAICNKRCQELAKPIERD